MLSYSTTRNPALAAALVCCLAAPVRADDTGYLPSNCVIVYSLDLAGFLKSKLYQEAKGKIKDLDEEMKRSLREEFGFPGANLTRVTAGVALRGENRREEFVLIATTLKPVAAADIKANRKVHPFHRNFSYKETKVGEHTIYQESYSFDFKGPLQSGRAFCVVEKNIIVYSQDLESLANVLQNKKKPKHTKNMEAGLKATGLDGMFSFVFDVTAFPEREKRSMIRELGGKLPGLENIFDGLQTFTLKATADDKVKATATMTCKDAAAAGDFRKIAEAGIVLVKGIMKKEAEREGTSPEEKQVLQAISRAFDAVKITAKDAQVNGEATLDAATAIAFLQGMFGHRKAESKDFPDDKK